MKERYEKIRLLIKERECEKKKNLQLKDFYFMVANLKKVLPEISSNRYWDIYLNIAYTMGRRNFDTNFPNKRASIIEESNIKIEKIINKQSIIFVTCHLGFCKASLINLYFKGIQNIKLLVDDRTYNREKGNLQVNELLSNLFGSTFSFEMINVEKPNIGIELLNYLENGISLVVYIDGNSGYKGIYNKDNTDKIKVLGNEINVKNGFSTLAYISKTPIVTYISYYRELDGLPVVEFLDVFENNSSQTLNDFNKNTIQCIYDSFSPFLKKYFDQWETWFYIHKFFDKNTLVDSSSILDLEAISLSDFREFKYGLFKIDTNPYIFDIENLKAYPIDSRLFEGLHANINY